MEVKAARPGTYLKFPGPAGQPGLREAGATAALSKSGKASGTGTAGWDGEVLSHSLTPWVRHPLPCLSISKAELRVPGAGRWRIPILPYGQLRFSHTMDATPRITPRSLPPSPSPGLWGRSWLPHGSLSRGPGLTGVTADRGVLFLGRLLLPGAAPPRGPGQHTASEGRGGQRRAAPLGPASPGPLAQPASPLPSPTRAPRGPATRYSPSLPCEP